MIEHGIFYLEKCNEKNSNELICTISKKLEEIMERNNEQFNFRFNNGEDSGEPQYPQNLYINYKYPIKEDIYVKITKLPTNCAQTETTILIKNIYDRKSKKN